MKWYLIYICLVFEWKVELFSILMTLWLSLYNLLFSCFIPNSSIKLCNQVISLLAYVAATYSASIVESATTFCSFEIQLTIVPAIVKNYLVALLLLPLSLSISTSTYPCRIVFGPLKHNAWEVVPLKYPRIHYIAFQCSLLRFFIYLLITPTACVISGLVHTMAYIKLLTVDE